MLPEDELPPEVLSDVFPLFPPPLVLEPLLEPLDEPFPEVEPPLIVTSSAELSLSSLFHPANENAKAKIANIAKILAIFFIFFSSKKYRLSGQAR